MGFDFFHPSYFIRNNNLVKSFICSFLAFFFISCTGGCALFQNEGIMLNSKRPSIGIISTRTFLRVSVRTSTNTIIIVETSTTPPPPTDWLSLYTSAASGAVVQHKDKVSFILTAAHVCTLAYKEQIQSIFPFYEKKTHMAMWSHLVRFHDIEGKQHRAIPLVWSKLYDVCIMVTPRLEQPALRLAFRAPYQGEKIYYMGFPRGIGGGKFIPTFAGYYIGAYEVGERENRGIAAGYSIPIAPGSSGSSVLNANGNIVGMLHSYYPRFGNIGLSATHEQLKKLFKNAEKGWKNKKNKSG